jgi:hypothetical protein
LGTQRCQFENYNIYFMVVHLFAKDFKKELILIREIGPYASPVARQKIAGDAGVLSIHLSTRSSLFLIHRHYIRSISLPSKEIDFVFFSSAVCRIMMATNYNYNTTTGTSNSDEYGGLSSHFAAACAINDNDNDNVNDNNDNHEEDADEETIKTQGVIDWKNAKSIATKFFEWLLLQHQGQGTTKSDSDYDDCLPPRLFENNHNAASMSIDLTSVDREEVHRLFEAFRTILLNQQVQVQVLQSKKEKKQHRRLEGLVMASLRQQKLFKTNRYNDGVVVCSFARPDKSFAPLKERRTARDKLIQQRQELQSDKGGIHVDEEPTVDPPGHVLIPINHKVTLKFPIRTIEGANHHLPIQLIDVVVSGPHKKSFEVQTRTPGSCSASGIEALTLSFQSTGNGVYRASFAMIFQNNQQERFSIQRSVLLRSGDADMYDILKPKTPYVKKKRNKFDKPPEKVLNAPQQEGGGRGSTYKDLDQFKPPITVRELLQTREMEGTLVPPSYGTPTKELRNVYSTFWQNLLWATELQAYEDIKLFDMENARLERRGRFFKLYVAGLAEGRPSVLRGDVVKCTWQGKLYEGRVYAVELLDVLMEFHDSFHRKFNVKTDTVDIVRFTFSRTAFRTAHEGVKRAPKAMGLPMLMPQTIHMKHIRGQQHQRVQRTLPRHFAWASQALNEEQKSAIAQIAKGTMRPMPYVIFGPPGTG